MKTGSITSKTPFWKETADVEEEAFYRAEVLKRAVVRELEIIGEAAYGMSDGLTIQYPEVPWRQIIATAIELYMRIFM